MKGRPPKNARKWYAKHGFDVIPEDWGKRDPETGEGLENVGNAYWGESRDGRDRSVTRLPHGGLHQFVVWLEDHNKLSTLWHERGEEEREVLEALEDFFTPYIATLPKEKASVLDQYLGQRRTQEQIADERGVSQQAVSKQLRAAFRALINRIAADAHIHDEYLNIGPDGTASELAWFVFECYWYERFERRFNG
jgi:predicted DNA-binding protein YlxM (UPF0122 family)